MSGMSEPFGAILFGLIFLPLITESLLIALLCLVGGIMFYISVDELLPVGHCFGNSNSSIIGLGVGIFIMAVSLAVLL